ncbi:HlyD family secretion protein [Jannaschia ovalis]|uniref:Efflux RND transporter periplasmic adaptor subunit n=1 Tax=Jannaschia ovalis TaxID=3038773 RepID=A0ABY8LA33_9RHOB|nr:efflux RND transporter periplasmic adaptor subunit [Jannaschia sp. GRR-S6-38]WGH77986.1 efflux RND transporter periplasmic adaptor subunit [Jannaschia sp. GRR-S6-38]
MSEQTENEGSKPDDPAKAKTGSRKARFSMSKVVLTIAGLVLGATALLMTMSPDLPERDAVALDEAFVHGAVTHVGIAEDGRIAELRVGLGDAVAAGEIVAVLEDAEIAALLRASEADIARLRAELRRAEVADDVARAILDSDLEQARAAIAAAEARRDAALAERARAGDALARQGALADRGLVAAADLEEIRKDDRAAAALLARRVAELAEAQAALGETRARAARDALRAAERDVLRARIAEARAERTRVEAALARTEIDAKEAGVVVNVAARAGASVRPNDTIVSIWNTDRVWMRAWVSEDQVSRIAVGDAARIEIDALDGQKFEGVVHRILVAEDGQEQLLPGQPVSPLLPEESRFAVQVSFDPTPALRAALLPGMSGRVRIATDGSGSGSGGPAMELLSRLGELLDGWSFETAEAGSG